MADSFIFADEAGCFTFKRQEGASRYFLLCTITTNNCDGFSSLLAIRRRLNAAGEPNRIMLHATKDSQAVRDEVYELIAAQDFTIDCTILEKSKAQPQTRADATTFYRYAWYYHLKHVAPRYCVPGQKTLITAASIGLNKQKAAFKECVNNSIQQIIPREQWEVCYIESAQDPCLWVADYCAWAIQRKWERQDSRSYDLIRNKITSEFDLWRNGNVHHY